MKVTLQFIKDLIDSDFLMVDYKKELSLKNKSVVQIKNQKSIVLDLLESNKNMKQFIRNLQFLRKNELFLLQIIIENSFYEEILNKTFKGKKTNKKIKIISTYVDLKVLKNTKKIKTMFLVLNNTKIPFNQLFYQNIHLIHQMNNLLELKNYGQYKITNTINTINKLVFLICIIKETLTLRNENTK